MDRQRAARAVDELLRAVGRDPATEPDLFGTGERVADAYADLCAGYAVDVDALVRENLIDQKGDGVVLLDGIALSTMCPHHLMPASGTATVAYAANDRIVGVGAIARVVDAFSRRLTLQETIGAEVTRALDKHLAPRWVSCRISMQHSCMSSRGERRHGARLVTLSILGDRDEATKTLGSAT